MANKTTNLDLLSESMVDKEERVNEFLDATSRNAIFGRRASTCSGLTWGYYGGKLLVSGTPTDIANGTLNLTNNATCYIKRTAAGVVSFVTSSPSGWPGPLSGTDVALYEVTTSGGLVTNWIDYRVEAAGPPGANGATGATGPEGPVRTTRVDAHTYAASITFDLDDYDMGEVTLTGNLTANFTGGYDGQIFRLRLKQDGTGGRTIGWGTMVRFGSDLTSVTLSTAANKTDYLAVCYHETDGKYDVMSYARGF